MLIVSLLKPGPWASPAAEFKICEGLIANKLTWSSGYRVVDIFALIVYKMTVC